MPRADARSSYSARSRRQQLLNERVRGATLFSAVRCRVESCARSCSCDGARRIRTADLLGAIQALSQLSYSPAEV
jgi:hypothetical protein